ncbi:MAG: hypothetical protein WD097_00540 [Balneolales bacterium]
MRGDQEQVDEIDPADEVWTEEHSRHTGRSTRDSSSGIDYDGHYSETTRSDASSSGTSPTPAGHQNKPGEQSWEDFFGGLEDMLGGKIPGDRTSQQSTRDASHSTGFAFPGEGETPAQSKTPEEHRHPSHGPVYGASHRKYGQASGSSDSGQAHRPDSTYKQPNSIPRDKYTRDTYIDTDMEKHGELSEEVSRDLIDSKNPIYTTLDESPEVVVAGTSRIKNVKNILHDREKLRDGFVLKEILDPPKSRRHHYHRY